MPKLNVEIPHQLPADELKNRLKRFSEVLGDKFKDQIKDFSQSWEGDDLLFSFKTMGLKIGGKLLIHDDKVALDGDLPFAAMMFKGKIESEIKQQLERLVS